MSIMILKDKMYLNKAAFTLAETLITLGIIGVVAAMTIPNLIENNYERKTISHLKETQSILAQAMKMAEEEYGDAEGWFDSSSYGKEESAVIIAQNLKYFLKLALDCGTSDPDGNCVPASYFLRNGSSTGVDHQGNTRYYKIKLLNGSSVWFRSGKESKRLITFFIDTNGKKLPNQYGKDLFVFSYYENGLRPLGASDSDSPYETNCKNKNSTGYGCAYYVLTQNNMNYLRNK